MGSQRAAVRNNFQVVKANRFAIARALSLGPDAILFDEPDFCPRPRNGWEVLKIVQDLAKEGLTMIVVTTKWNLPPMSLAGSSSWTRVSSLSKEIQKKSLAIPKKNGPRNSFNASYINLLKQFAYQYGSKLFFTTSAFEASKKPESKLSGFQLEQQINLRIFDDFCHKINQSKCSFKRDILHFCTSLSQGNDRHFTGICFFTDTISRNFLIAYPTNN